MLCAQPVTAETGSGPQAVGCGQCLNCLVNRRRQWTGRILLEGLSTERDHREVTWSTMTYAEENIPTAGRGAAGPMVRTLRPADVQLLFKRLRKRDSLGSFRVAYVGEYGDCTQRPHYHAMFFGPAPELVERELQRHWEPLFGHTQTRPWRLGNDAEDAHRTRSAYIANYTTKKMSQVDSPKLGPSRHREFFQASRRPGLGHCRMLLDLFTTEGAAIKMAETGDVPRSVRVAGTVWPLAPKTRAWLRDELGIPQTRKERREAFPEAQDDRVAPSSEDYAAAKLQHEKMVRRKVGRNGVL